MFFHDTMQTVFPYLENSIMAAPKIVGFDPLNAYIVYTYIEG